MDLGLHGLNAIVTGATRGIGRAIADTLADEGANVAICARHADDVEAAVGRAAGKGRTGHRAGPRCRRRPRAAGWVRDVAVELGGIDIVVANVSALAIGGDEDSLAERVPDRHDGRGASGRRGDAQPRELGGAGDRDDLQRLGPRDRLRLRRLRGVQGGPRPLHAGSRLPPGRPGIRANTVSPGNTYFAGGVWAQIETGNPELFAAALGLNPTGRMGTPQEMANAVAFIASPRASFITGANLVVDGALTKGVQL